MNNCEGSLDTFSIQPKNFFEKETFLTVSSQLHLESMIPTFQKVFSLGPVFRAEKHNSRRHLAEFWMLEIEIANITELEELIDVLKGVLSHVSAAVFSKAKNQLENLGIKHDEQNDLIRGDFKILSYQEAIKVLNNSNNSLLNNIKQGERFTFEHENYLCQSGPIIIKNYPKNGAPFYMKMSDEYADNFDLLYPKIGELVGGSLRENDVNTLRNRISSENIKNMDWYIDIREYGCPPHGGFGLGIDRLVQAVCSVANINDIIPFPRGYKNIIA